MGHLSMPKTRDLGPYAFRILNRLARAEALAAELQSAHAVCTQEFPYCLLGAAVGEAKYRARSVRTLAVTRLS